MRIPRIVFVLVVCPLLHCNNPSPRIQRQPCTEIRHLLKDNWRYDPAKKIYQMIGEDAPKLELALARHRDCVKGMQKHQIKRLLGKPSWIRDDGWWFYYLDEVCARGGANQNGCTSLVVILDKVGQATELKASAVSNSHE